MAKEKGHCDSSNQTCDKGPFCADQVGKGKEIRLTNFPHPPGIRVMIGYVEVKDYI